eukprot:gb/GFBE01054246.1/.p1 GENE.gb/GFBE01054246.1/~~gb/GFBE01054246.1/.p1  ORF type:complete len:2043 (+),score=316.69 gb/GFBE01054246.1/:1-6129(+)
MLQQGLATSFWRCLCSAFLLLCVGSHTAEGTASPRSSVAGHIDAQKRHHKSGFPWSRKLYQDHPAGVAPRHSKVPARPSSLVQAWQSLRDEDPPPDISDLGGTFSGQLADIDKPPYSNVLVVRQHIELPFVEVPPGGNISALPNVTKMPISRSMGLLQTQERPPSNLTYGEGGFRFEADILLDDVHFSQTIYHDGIVNISVGRDGVKNLLSFTFGRNQPCFVKYQKLTDFFPVGIMHHYAFVVEPDGTRRVEIDGEEVLSGNGSAGGAFDDLCGSEEEIPISELTERQVSHLKAKVGMTPDDVTTLFKGKIENIKIWLDYCKGCKCSMDYGRAESCCGQSHVEGTADNRYMCPASRPLCVGFLAEARKIDSFGRCLRQEDVTCVGMKETSSAPQQYAEANYSYFPSNRSEAADVINVWKDVRSGYYGPDNTDKRFLIITLGRGNLPDQAGYAYPGVDNSSKAEDDNEGGQSTFDVFLGDVRATFPASNANLPSSECDFGDNPANLTFGSRPDSGTRLSGAKRISWPGTTYKIYEQARDCVGMRGTENLPGFQAPTNRPVLREQDIIDIWINQGSGKYGPEVKNMRYAAVSLRKGQPDGGDYEILFGDQFPSAATEPMLPSSECRFNLGLKAGARPDSAARTSERKSTIWRGTTWKVYKQADPIHYCGYTTFQAKDSVPLDCGLESPSGDGCSVEKCPDVDACVARCNVCAGCVGFDLEPAGNNGGMRCWMKSSWSHDGNYRKSNPDFWTVTPYVNERDPACHKESCTDDECYGAARLVYEKKLCLGGSWSAILYADNLGNGTWDPLSCQRKLLWDSSCSKEWFGVASETGHCWCVPKGMDCDFVDYELAIGTFWVPNPKEAPKNEVRHIWLDESMTYSSAVQACSRIPSFGLCTAAEICPRGELVDGPVGIARDGNVWVPVVDEADEWLQIGSNNTCWTHNGPVRLGLSNTFNAGPPVWGKHEWHEGKGNVYCCHKDSSRPLAELHKNHEIHARPKDAKLQETDSWNRLRFYAAGNLFPETSTEHGLLKAPTMRFPNGSTIAVASSIGCFRIYGTVAFEGSKGNGLHFQVGQGNNTWVTLDFDGTARKTLPFDVRLDPDLDTVFQILDRGSPDFDFVDITAQIQCQVTASVNGTSWIYKGCTDDESLFLTKNSASDGGRLAPGAREAVEHTDSFVAISNAPGDGQRYRFESLKPAIMGLTYSDCSKGCDDHTSIPCGCANNLYGNDCPNTNWAVWEQAPKLDCSGLHVNTPSGLCESHGTDQQTCEASADKNLRPCAWNKNTCQGSLFSRCSYESLCGYLEVSGMKCEGRSHKSCFASLDSNGHLCGWGQYDGSSSKKPSCYTTPVTCAEEPTQIYVTGPDGKVYNSPLSGLYTPTSWKLTSKGGIAMTLIVGDTIWAVGTDYKVYAQSLTYMSPYTEWMPAGSGDVVSIAIIDNCIYAAGKESGVYKQILSIMTPSSVWEPIDAGATVISLAVSAGTLYAIFADDRMIYRADREQLEAELAASRSYRMKLALAYSLLEDPNGTTDPGRSSFWTLAVKGEPMESISISGNHIYGRASEDYRIYNQSLYTLQNETDDWDLMLDNMVTQSFFYQTNAKATPATHANIQGDFEDRISYVELCENRGEDCKGSMEFKLFCMAPAAVTMEVQVVAPDPGSDTFNIEINGGQCEYPWQLKSYGGQLCWEDPKCHYSTDWRWTQPSIPCQLSAGAHNVVIRGKEDGVKIRRIRLVSGATVCSLSKSPYSWKLLLHQSLPASFSYEERVNLKGGSPEGNVFMDIGSVDADDINLRFQGKYLLKASWDDYTVVWKQSSWITAWQPLGFECVEPQECDTALETQHTFKGLSRVSNTNYDSSIAIFDGDGAGESSWWEVGRVDSGVESVTEQPSGPNGTYAKSVKLFVATSGERMIGPQGAQGAPGRRGKQGRTGQLGPPGIPGVAGSHGPMGQRGHTGPPGPRGDPGFLREDEIPSENANYYHLAGLLALNFLTLIFSHLCLIGIRIRKQTPPASGNAMPETMQGREEAELQDLHGPGETGMPASSSLGAQR